MYFFWIPASRLDLARLVAGMTVWLIFPFSAYSVGISVSPPSLELRGAPNKKITGAFTVTNPSRETVIYEITNDGLFSLAITPTTFLLEPNKSAIVSVEYQPIDKLTTDKLTTTQLSVLGRPLTVNPTQAASGIKLPVSIATGQVAGAATRRYDPMMMGIILFDALLLAWLFYLIIKRLRMRSTHP